MNQELASKYENLQSNLRKLGSLAVGFSGGVDSTLLCKVAHDVLGDHMIAVTIKSAFVPETDFAEAQAFTKREGIEHVIVPSDILAVPGVDHNPPDRCYLCKTTEFSTIKRVAAQRGITYVADGSNVDDMGDYRPGRKAIAELDVKSPLLEAQLTKQDIRDISHELGLPTWNKPSAACLASRLPYGDLITQEKLDRIDSAEEFLHGLGFTNVRVRTHGDIARIEVPPQRIADLANDPVRTSVVVKLKQLGFTFVTLDLQGYRTGSLNEELKLNENH